MGIKIGWNTIIQLIKMSTLYFIMELPIVKSLLKVLFKKVLLEELDKLMNNQDVNIPIKK
jgi:hypothetical protein